MEFSWWNANDYQQEYPVTNNGNGSIIFPRNIIIKIKEQTIDNLRKIGDGFYEAFENDTPYEMLIDFNPSLSLLQLPSGNDGYIFVLQNVSSLKTRSLLAVHLDELHEKKQLVLIQYEWISSSFKRNLSWNINKSSINLEKVLSKPGNVEKESVISTSLFEDLNVKLIKKWDLKKEKFPSNNFSNSFYTDCSSNKIAGLDSELGFLGEEGFYPNKNSVKEKNCNDVCSKEKGEDQQERKHVSEQNSKRQKIEENPVSFDGFPPTASFHHPQPIGHPRETLKEISRMVNFPDSVSYTQAKKEKLRLLLRLLNMTSEDIEILSDTIYKDKRFVVIITPL